MLDIGFTLQALARGPSRLRKAHLVVLLGFLLDPRLLGLPEGTPVRLERDVEARDDYGRLLAYVFVTGAPGPDDDLFVRTIPSDTLQATAIAEYVIRTGQRSVVLPPTPGSDHATIIGAVMMPVSALPSSSWRQS